MEDTQLLVTDEREASENTQGCCGMDCGKWVSWRSGDQNRAVYKAACSFLFIANVGIYMYYVWQGAQDPIVLWIMGVVFVVKGLIEVWGQNTPTWICPGTLLLLTVVYMLGLPGIMYMLGHCTNNPDIDFPHRDVVALILNVFGSIYSLSYEMGRFWWKAKPENKGKLHTIGLARFCIHPNYFGDLFTYSGWALATGTSCNLSTPLLMIWMFAYFVMPNSDAYLAQRYPTEFPAYAEKTATLIPFFNSSIGLKIIGWLGFVASMWAGNECTAACA